jgi:hypothetical protein
MAEAVVVAANASGDTSDGVPASDADSASVSASGLASDSAPHGAARGALGRDRCGRRSDGGLSTVGFFGDFARGHALFSLYRLGPDQSQYPNGPCEYLVDCDDGVGPHEVCRFSVDESERDGSKLGEFDVVWRGSWKGDQWCGWIMGHVRALIAAAGDD